MHRIAATTALLAASLCATPDAAADDAPLPADKGGRSLVDPTPKELRRPFSADRPDTTESPYTVDAGAVQLEMSFVDYTRDGDAEAWAFAPANLKLGLLNDVDLQFVFDPYTRADDGARTIDGFGDVQFRLKINLWGNDEGRTAFALMPFLQIPTAADGLGSDHVQGGVILPFALELAEGLGLGLMLQTEFVHDEQDDALDTEFLASAVLGADITRDVGLYVEGVVLLSTDGDVDPGAVLGAGTTYALTADLQLDLGVNVGLAGDTDDLNVFTGMSIRF